MTSPVFATLDASTGQIPDVNLPQRLQVADLNETIEDRVGGMFPGATYNDTLGIVTLPGGVERSAGIRAQISPGVALTSDAVTDLALGVTLFNSNMDLTTNAGKITVPTGAAGRYVATASMRYSAGAAGLRSTLLKVTGTVVREANIPTSGDTRPGGSWVVQLAAGDVVSLAVYVTGAGVVAISTADNDINLCLAKVGP